MRELARALFANKADAGATLAGAAPATETVTGEVISVWCYIQNAQNVREAGYLCALADLKWEGNPPGLLTTAGKVYQLAGAVLGENNARLVPYIGKTITVSGEVVEKDGVRILTAGDMRVAAR